MKLLPWALYFIFATVVSFAIFNTALPIQYQLIAIILIAGGPSVLIKVGCE